MSTPPTMNGHGDGAPEDSAPLASGADNLLPHHAKLLAGSAISAEVARQRGYRSVVTKEELRALGFANSQLRVPGLLIPICSVDGRIGFHQLRPDTPRDRNGKPIKYETPAGARMCLDIHPSMRACLGDPSRRLWITEGVRKSDAAIGLDLCCLALLGVYNWRGTNEHGGSTALGDWESIASKGRDVCIVFDSDVVVKKGVEAALVRLKEFLESRGARVKVVYLPAGNGGEKVGLDDFIAAGNGEAELLALASSEIHRAYEPGEVRPDCPYEGTPSGIVLVKQTRQGEVRRNLTNFTARIVANVLVDDGVTRRRYVDMRAHFRDRETTFRVLADDFANSSWVLEHLGAEAIIYPVGLCRDHLRTAIQELSEHVVERIVHAHTGWIKTTEGWCYLHAGGAIGPEGVREGIEVELPSDLSRYWLPAPPTVPELVVAARNSLALLELGPIEIMAPLLGSIYRSVIGEVDFGLHLAGRTGAFKTEIAALIQQHWGSEMDSRKLPASWISTGNSLEALCFTAKDAILVVDDFAPRGSTSDIQRLHREADRLFRAQGNGAGRQRMNADAGLRPARPPRGLILSTGEDVPRGHSLQARMFILELAHGMISSKSLSSAQRLAADGEYARALAGFIHWLAPRYESIQERTRARIREMRGVPASSQTHRRTPEIVANLAVGWEFFVEFAQGAGALTASEAALTLERCRGALHRAGERQAGYQASADPAQRYLDLLRAALSSGRCHLATTSGSAPERPEAWGWKQQSGQWQSAGARIGWLDDENLYLEPDAALAAVQAFARDQSDPFPLTKGTLHKRLHEQGLLAATDERRSTLTVRKVIGGTRQEVLSMRTAALFGFEADQTDQAGGVK